MPDQILPDELAVAVVINGHPGRRRRDDAHMHRTGRAPAAAAAGTAGTHAIAVAAVGASAAFLAASAAVVHLAPAAAAFALLQDVARGTADAAPCHRVAAAVVA